MKNNLLGTKAVHAAINGLHEGDTAMASLCKPDKALLKGTWVSDKVTCRVCLQRINSAHVEALALNKAYAEGVAEATSWLEQVGEGLAESFISYNNLFLREERNALAGDLRRYLVSSGFTFTQRLQGVGYYAHRLTVIKAEIARRQKLVKTEPMVTENNYGERTAEQKADERVRLVRAEEATRVLVRGITLAGRPEPSEDEMRAALVSLDHTEAIEEDRARFPYESFTRFEMPVPCGYRHKDGSIERPVFVIGSDVSRRIYNQNVMLMVRSDSSVPQVVGEGDLVS